MPVAVSRPLGVRRRPKPFWPSREAFLTDAALFVFGASGIYSFSLIGALPGSEVLLFAFLPVLLLFKGGRAFESQYLRFYLMAGGWLLGTLISDRYNAIPMFNSSKGIARVGFFILDFMALAIFLNRKTRRILIFVLSLSFVMLVTSFQFAGEFSLQWKFGISQGVAILALLGSSYFYAKQKYRFCVLISVVLAGLNLIYGFRSQLGVQFVAAVLILPLFAQSARRQEAQNPARVLLLLALALGAAYAANSAIKYAARHEFFDESQNQKFLGQSEGDYGVLVGGRPETLVAIQAIIDRPIIGHGSFPFELKYWQLKQDIQYEHGYSESDRAEETDAPVIPTHSHLTLAWVEGGILGGICWIYILILTVRGVLRLTSLRPPLAPLYSYLLLSFLWDILYSPFGSVNRIRAAFYVLLSYMILGTPLPARARRLGAQTKVVVARHRRFPRLASRPVN
jgi:hypothetical protein